MAQDDGIVKRLRRKAKLLRETGAPEGYGSINGALDDAADRIEALEEGLRSFLQLSISPDAAPGPSCYIVEPVQKAREAWKQAGILINGESPFPSDNNGSVMVIRNSDGTEKRSVWFDGRAYGEDSAHLVPEQHKEAFRAALLNHRD